MINISIFLYVILVLYFSLCHYSAVLCTCTYLKQLEVECKSSTETSIPSNIPINTTVLHINYNLLKSINSTTISRLLQLQSISIYNALFTSIDSYTFVNMASLQSIYIHSFMLTVIKDHAFVNLPNLKNLYFDNNALRTVSTNAFVNVPVSTFGIRNNSGYIDNTIFLNAFKYVRSLILHSVNINTLTSFTFSSTLKSLQLQSCNLNANKVNKPIQSKRLLNVFQALSNIKALSIVDSSLSNFYISGLKNLKTLRLEQNVGGITANNIVLRHLPSLRILHLKRMNLTSVPRLVNIKNLRKLYLNGNRLHNITDSFHINQYTNLRMLSLSDNMLFNKLDDLDTGVSHKAMKKFKNLRRIYLNNNNLEYITDDVFEGFRDTLKEIKIANNNISLFALQKYYKSLESVNVSFNNLKTFRSGPNYHVLWMISNNPLKCSCLLLQQSFNNTVMGDCQIHNKHKIQIINLRNQSLCQNDGHCHNETCTCKIGFYGEFCEIHHCHSNTCIHGKCKTNETNSMSPQCECDQGFTGKHCNLKTGFCVDHDCRNEGICREKQNGFYCVCPIGYTGAACEHVIHRLASTIHNKNNSLCKSTAGRCVHSEFNGTWPIKSYLRKKSTNGLTVLVLLVVILIGLLYGVVLSCICCKKVTNKRKKDNDHPILIIHGQNNGEEDVRLCYLSNRNLLVWKDNGDTRQLLENDQ